MDIEGYLPLLLGIFAIIATLAILSFVFFRIKAKGTYTTIEGRIRIKGKENFSGIKVSIGKMKDKDKLALAIVKSSDGQPLIGETDAKGKFIFQGVPVGNYMLMADAIGQKSALKLIKLRAVQINRISDILLGE